MKYFALFLCLIFVGCDEKAPPPEPEIVLTAESIQKSEKKFVKFGYTEYLGDCIGSQDYYVKASLLNIKDTGGKEYIKIGSRRGLSEYYMREDLDTTQTLMLINLLATWRY